MAVLRGRESISSSFQVENNLGREACAEAGNFGKAVATAQAAADLAQTQGYPQTALTIRQCADNYREKQPLREVWTNLVLE